MSVRAIEDHTFQVAEEQCSCKQTPFLLSQSIEDLSRTLY